MAKVKFGPIVTDVRGSIANTVWSKTGKSGIGVKSPAGTRSNPQSTQQSKVRACVTQAGKVWKDILTPEQRSGWEALAKSLSVQTGLICNVRNLIPQGPGIMSGWNLFLALYVPLCRCDIPITADFYDAPIGLTAPASITNFLATWAPPFVPNYALNLDGVNEYVDVGNVLGYEYNQPQSWEAWIYPLGDLVNDGIIAKRIFAATRGYQFRIGLSKLIFSIFQRPPPETLQVEVTFGFTGVWKHVVATYDGSNNANGMRLYRDAVQNQVVTFNVPLTATIQTTDPLRFGIMGNTLGTALTGRLACIRNYNRVLTQPNVNTLFNAGAGLYGADPFGDGSCQGAWMFCTGSGITLFDISGNSYNGTLTNMEPADWIPGKVPCPPLPAHIDLTWTDPVTVTPGSVVRIWIRSRQLGVHKQLIACVDIGEESFDLTFVRMAQGALHFITDFPGNYLVQADVLQPNGLGSNPSNTVEVVVP